MRKFLKRLFQFLFLLFALVVAYFLLIRLVFNAAHMIAW